MKKKELKQEIERLQQRVEELEAENARLRIMQSYQPFQPLPAPIPWVINPNDPITITTASDETEWRGVKIWYSYPPQ